MNKERPDDWDNFVAAEYYRRECDEVDVLRAENVRLLMLVRQAYNEGFGEGMKEDRTFNGGKPWEDSAVRKALESTP